VSEINLSTTLLVRRNGRIRERLIPVAKIHLQESQAPGPSARLLFYRLRYFGAEYHGKHVRQIYDHSKRMKEKRMVPKVRAIGRGLGHSHTRLTPRAFAGWLGMAFAVERSDEAFKGAVPVDRFGMKRSS
jgi:hypothetical protein